MPNSNSIFDIFDYLGIPVTDNLETVQKALDDLPASKMADLRKKPAFSQLRRLLYSKRATPAYLEYVQEIRELRQPNQQNNNQQNNNQQNNNQQNNNQQNNNQQNYNQQNYNQQNYNQQNYNQQNYNQQNYNQQNYNQQNYNQQNYNQQNYNQQNYNQQNYNQQNYNQQNYNQQNYNQQNYNQQNYNQQNYNQQNYNRQNYNRRNNNRRNNNRRTYNQRERDAYRYAEELYNKKFNNEDNKRALIGLSFLFFVCACIIIVFCEFSNSSKPLSKPVVTFHDLDNDRVRISWEPVENADYYILENIGNDLPKSESIIEIRNKTEFSVARYKYRKIVYLLTACSDNKKYTPSSSIRISIDSINNRLRESKKEIVEFERNPDDMLPVKNGKSFSKVVNDKMHTFTTLKSNKEYFIIVTAIPNVETRFFPSSSKTIS